MERWQPYFKQAVVIRGEELFLRAAPRVSLAGNANIEAQVQDKGRKMVRFAIDSQAPSTVNASCSCWKPGRAQFCLHLWSSLRALETHYPEASASWKELNLKPEEDAGQAARLEKAQLLRSRQADYRKAAYEKSKERNRAFSQKIKPAAANSSAHSANSSREKLAEPTQNALKYFSLNGFEFAYPLDLAALNAAKKLLSRVFHPDRGGTHEEMLTLHHHFDVLSQDPDLNC